MKGIKPDAGKLIHEKSLQGERIDKSNPVPDISDIQTGHNPLDRAMSDSLKFVSQFQAMWENTKSLMKKRLAAS